MAARPKTLWAAVSPVLIGTAMAFGDAKGAWLPAAAALFGAVMIQVGTNFANDYFDYRTGADAGPRLGPLRVTQAGLVRPETMRAAFCLAFFLAALAGAYLTWHAGWPIAVIAVVSIASGILYTAGPYPLGYIGLGDVFVLIFFGPVSVGGTYYVQALEINTAVLVAGLAPGLFSVAILTVNNLRDISGDETAGKRTLAVRFGRRFARIEYVVCVIAGSCVPVVLFWMDPGRVFSLAALAVPLLAIPSFGKVLRSTEGPVLNQVLAATGKLLLIYSAVFSAGWIA